MRKILELCVLLISGVIYIVSTTTFQLSKPDILFITKFTCEVLRIVLAIGGVVLVYNNMSTKMNNRANYIALTSCVSGLLIIFGMKQYILVNEEMNSGIYELFRLLMEWIQIMMLFFCIQFIHENSSIERWVIAELGIAFLMIAFFCIDIPMLNCFFEKLVTQVTIRMASVVLISILMVICYSGNWSRTVFEEKTFLRMFMIKLIIGVLGITRVLMHNQVLHLVQYMLQVAFMIETVIYIDGITLGGTWAKIEIGAKMKSKEVQSGKNEQQTMVTAAEEIKGLISKMEYAILDLEKALSEQYGQKGQKYIDKIKNNSNRLLKLSRNIAELNTYDLENREPHFQKVDLSAMFGEMVESLDTYVKQKGIHLEFVVSKEHIEADVDQNALERIFLNLISNAVKYNHENGSIKVILSQKKKQVYLCVQDTGIGIPNYFLKDIFNKFKRVDSQMTHTQEGSGLGLFIVKALVDMHHGEIQIVSKEGKGTLISIGLPVEQAFHETAASVKREKKNIEHNIQVELSDLKR